jgi:hypothetical protein
MRVSSLSDERIIKLVSTYFVPAWMSRDHYQQDRPNPEQDALLHTIDRSRMRQKLEGGSVCVYIVTAKGEVLATLPVQKASNPDLLRPFLEKITAEQKLSPRDPAAVRASAAPLPDKRRPETPDGLLFTIRTRVDRKGPNRGTSRDIVELTHDEWAGFLPKAQARVGDTWPVPAATAAKLLRYTYPPLPSWNVDHGKLEVGKLEVKVAAAGAKDVALQLTGEVVLLYPNVGKPNDGKVTAKLVGVAHADPAAKRLKSLEAVSEQGQYLWHWQGKPMPAPMSIAIELGP